MSERNQRQAAAESAGQEMRGQWSESAARVLRERYLKKNERGEPIESPDELCWRVARAIAAAEATNSGRSPEEIEAVAATYADLMLSRRFMPNSPTLANAGKGNNMQLSACFVLPVPDDLEGIFQTIKHVALVQKSGGGTGMAFSRLRPKDSIVSTTKGVASGPVSFMKVFDAATEGIRQGGMRRGANMGILRADHPDIEEFIDCKRTGGITNFNISVAITDAFMDALARNDEYDLVDPHTQVAVRRVRARDIFNKIVNAAWATGDPGLVFIDRANHSTANPVPELEQLEATNPCVVGTTLLATDRGLRRMDDLYASGQEIVVATDARLADEVYANVANGGPLLIPSGVIFRPAVPVFQTGKQVAVRKLTTSHGIEITATPNHRFMTTQGYKRLDQLEYGDELLLQSGEGAWPTDTALPAIALGIRSEARLRAKIAHGEAQPPTEWSRELGEVLGYVLGDGYVRRSDTSDVVGIAIDLADADIKNTIQRRFTRWFGVAGNVTERHGYFQVMYEGTPGTFLMGLGISANKAHEKRVPASVFAAPREAVIGFLRGLFSADGSVQSSEEKGACSIRLATSSKGLAQDVQQSLLNFGIVSAIRLRREKMLRLLPNAQREPAEYTTQAQYEVIIDKANRDRFAEMIGFMQERKQIHLTEWISAKKLAANHETFITKVALIEDAGFADVFDTTEPMIHSLIFNGLITHNCGEQFLGPYDACNLGSINLGLFVHEGEVDWRGLEQTTRECARFLDDVIDVNPYPLQEIRDHVHANRRIGLGVMGWADMLFKLQIRYDSQAAIDLGERVMRAIQHWSSEETQRMAEERGAFPNWEHSIYRDGAKRRNATTTTVAPTGCQSPDTLIVSDQGVLRLEELGDIGGEQWQPLQDVHVAQESAEAPATRFYINGHAKTKVITLASGAVLECTPNHRYRAFVGDTYEWVEAAQLQPDDMIAIRIGGYSRTTEALLDPVSEQGRFGRREASFEYPTQMSPDLAYFLGIYAGDGSMHEKGLRFHFGHDDAEEIGIVIALAKRLFGLEATSRREHTCTSIYLNSVQLARWMRENNLAKTSSIEAAIPKAIRTSSKASIDAFIEGLYLADGSHNGHAHYIDTGSFRLAQDLLICLRAIGQNARVVTRINVAGRISDKPAYRVFFRSFGSVDHDHTRDRYIRRADREMAEIAHRFGEELHWDEVINVEDGENETFDIEVPERNTYLANNAVSHNTISIIADCSSGIEPIFALAFQHRVRQPDGAYRVLDFVNPIFVEALEASDVVEKDDVLAWVKQHGSLHGHPASVHPALRAFVTAHEVAPEWHIRMQAAYQKGVENSISKTINLPSSATAADVEHAYLMAWELGCLGITIFRDGSKGEQVLNVGVKKEASQAVAAPATAVVATPEAAPVVAPVAVAPVAAPTTAAPAKRRNYTRGVKDRPEVMHGYTRQVRAPEGKVNVTLNGDEDGLLEVFVTIGKAGSDVAALAEALGRLISLHLRVESPLSQNDRARAIAEQLRGIGGSSAIGLGPNQVRSLPDAVARAINQYLEQEGGAASANPGTSAGNGNGNGTRTGDGNGHTDSQSGIGAYTGEALLKVIGNFCPQCGSNTLVYEEGCKKCMGCGHSEC